VEVDVMVAVDTDIADMDVLLEDVDVMVAADNTEDDHPVVVLVVVVVVLVAAVRSVSSFDSSFSFASSCSLAVCPDDTLVEAAAADVGVFACATTRED
jgi:hypothetical protein